MEVGSDDRWEGIYKARYFRNPPSAPPSGELRWRHYVDYQGYINSDDYKYCPLSFGEYLECMKGYPTTITFAKCETDEESQRKWDTLDQTICKTRKAVTNNGSSAIQEVSDTPLAVVFPISE